MTMPWKPKIAEIWSKLPKVAERRLPFALFICGLLAYAAAFAWHMLANLDLVNLIRDVNYDDSFYYFQIAYNLSQGNFSTFDGGITQTNGYHPVWMLLITPFYLIFDKETALFGIKAFEIMLVAGGMALIATAAWLARLAWPLLFAALPMLFRTPYELLWGTEAAAAMFTLALLILAACLYMRSPDRWKWHVAAIAFALPWVRIEYIAISLAVTAALCVIEWSRQERRSLRLSELAGIRQAYIPLIGAIAGILVYFAYNWLVFGGILPVSAAAKLAMSQAQWAREGGYNFIENFQETLRLDPAVFDYELLIAFEICAYFLLIWRLALRSKDWRDWLLLAFLVGIFGLAAGHIAKFAQSVLILHPYKAHGIWHFVPAYLMTALIVPVRLYVAICLIRRLVDPRERTAINVLSIGVVVIGAATLYGKAGFATPFKWVDHVSVSSRLDWGVHSYMGVQVMNRALPEDSVIGSWDAGVIGYFSRFPVVNLDGLVNSYEHFRARQDQLHLKEDFDFYRRYDITHFANIWWYHRLPNNANVIFEVPCPDSPSAFALWTYDSEPDAHAEIDYSQQFWDSLEPRFDYSSGGVGVVLAGKTAWAFAKDCPPDEPMIWTWSEPKHERTVRLETTPYRSRANWCVYAHILPRNSGRPVHAEMRTLNARADIDFDKLANREPIIQSNFNVYLIDDNLIYTKPECSQDDMEARFFANVFPVDPNHLRNRRGEYDNIEFQFHDYGAIDDGRCWAAVDLPNYPIAEIHAGQYVETTDGYTHIWVGTYGERSYETAADADFAKFDDLASREPIIRSDFDVYILGDSLIYAKTDCGEEDVKPHFFASVFPLYEQSLTDSVKRRGYDAIDFQFHDYGAIDDDGRCWAEAPLPNYPINEIHVGQYLETTDGYHYLWGDAYRFE